MIKSIAIKNYKKFKKEVKLDFWNHKSKKIGQDFIINNSISSFIGILGKNASGKSSIIEALLLYNSLANNFYFPDILRKAYLIKVNKLYNHKYGKQKTVKEISKINKQILEIHSHMEIEEVTYSELIEDEVKQIIIEKYNEVANDSDWPISLTIEYYDESKQVITHKIKLSKNNVYEVISIGSKKVCDDKISLYGFNSKLHSILKSKGLNLVRIESVSNFDNQEKEWISLRVKDYGKKDPQFFKSFLQIADASIKEFTFNNKNEPIAYISSDSNKRLDFQTLSNGTLFFINLYYYLSLALFEQKTLILIDEIENSLHLALMKFIITIFKKRYNKLNSQLLFTTHNSHIFDERFKSNSIYFIDEHKLIRNEERYDKKIAPGYLKGELCANPDFRYRFEFLEKILAKNEKNR